MVSQILMVICFNGISTFDVFFFFFALMVSQLLTVFWFNGFSAFDGFLL